MGMSGTDWLDGNEYHFPDDSKLCLITVVIVDDHLMLAETLAATLNSCADTLMW